MNALFRRDAVLAVAAVSAGAALANAPLSAEEVRVLAMTATPREAWIGRENEYHETRTFDDGDATDDVVRCLEERGLVKRRFVAVAGERKDGMEFEVTATNEGMCELQRLGVVDDVAVALWAEREA